jgi:hypothetical protein
VNAATNAFAFYALVWLLRRFGLLAALAQVAAYEVVVVLPYYPIAARF